MKDASVIIALIASGFLGGVISWLLVRARIRQAADRTKGEFELQLAVSRERVADRDREIMQLRMESEEQKKQLAHIDSQWREESTLRAAIEERAKRIPQLEAQLANKDGLVGDLRNQITDLKSSRSELTTVLAKDREAFGEKLALLNEAQTRFSDAFRALSAEALQGNNHSFLELAKSTLERFQEAAKGDLGKRQQAIDQLVGPVKQSLEKFDFKIQELEKKSRVGAYEGLNQLMWSLAKCKLLKRFESMTKSKRLNPSNRGLTTRNWTAA